MLLRAAGPACPFTRRNRVVKIALHAGPGSCCDTARGPPGCQRSGELRATVAAGTQGLQADGAPMGACPRPDQRWCRPQWYRAPFLDVSVAHSSCRGPLHRRSGRVPLSPASETFLASGDGLLFATCPPP